MEEINETQEGFVDELDLKKYLTTVENKIDISLNKDYVIAKLDPIQKKYIIECVKNCSYTYAEFLRLAEAEKDKENKKKIIRMANNILMIFMQEPNSIAKLNRNEKENHLLNAILNNLERTEEEKSFPKQVIDVVKPQDEQGI